MNKILILSNNEELIEFCNDALANSYQINTVTDISANLMAALIIIDADKITQNKQLLPSFNTIHPRLLIVGNHWTDEQQIEALINGAAGYCSKTVSTKILLLAVESILKGDLWIQRHLVSKVIGILVQLKSTATATDIKQNKVESDNLLLTLSKRELEVAKMISLGASNKAIASTLSISERTVKAHLTSTFKKVHVPDRLHLALFIKEFN